MEETLYKRTPQNYDGVTRTAHQLPDLLPHIMKGLNRSYATQPALVLQLWPSIIGEKLAPFTKALRFENEILYVHVKNSALLSLLNIDKERLKERLEAKVPGIVLKNIIFRIG